MPQASLEVAESVIDRLSKATGVSEDDSEPEVESQRVGDVGHDSTPEVDTKPDRGSPIGLIVGTTVAVGTKVTLQSGASDQLAWGVVLITSGMCLIQDVFAVFGRYPVAATDRPGSLPDRQPRQARRAAVLRLVLAAVVVGGAASTGIVQFLLAYLPLWAILNTASSSCSRGLPPNRASHPVPSVVRSLSYEVSRQLATEQAIDAVGRGVHMAVGVTCLLSIVSLLGTKPSDGGAKRAESIATTTTTAVSAPVAPPPVLTGAALECGADLPLPVGIPPALAESQHRVWDEVTKPEAGCPGVVTEGPNGVIVSRLVGGDSSTAAIVGNRANPEHSAFVIPPHTAMLDELIADGTLVGVDQWVRTKTSAHHVFQTMTGCRISLRPHGKPGVRVDDEAATALLLMVSAQLGGLLDDVYREVRDTTTFYGARLLVSGQVAKVGIEEADSGVAVVVTGPAAVVGMEAKPGDCPSRSERAELLVHAVPND